MKTTVQEDKMLIPEYLYHYTSVEALESILNNRAIRFNSLINMDDMEEAKTSDFDCGGKYTYVSSWADDGETENVALWGMYTNNYQGVRIRMKSNPFNMFDIGPLPYFDGKSVVSCFQREMIERNNLYLYPTLSFTRRVEYTNDEKKILQSLQVNASLNPDGTYNLVANLNNLGRYKRKAWEVQKEIRYMFCVLPHTDDGRLSLNVGNNHLGMPFEYWDVPISDDGFNSIEVTIGPKMNVEAQNKVFILMNRFFGKDGTCRIRYSELKIK